MKVQHRRRKCGTPLSFLIHCFLCQLLETFFQAKPNEEPTGEEEAGGAAETEKLSSVDIGDSLPTLTLKNEKNEDIQIADLASEKGVVLFLVPKADTRK